MEDIMAVKLMNVLHNEGHDAEVREGYSGKGMFGKTTTGISTNATLPDILMAVIHAIPELADMRAEMAESVEYSTCFEDMQDIRFDHLGLGYIYY